MRVIDYLILFDLLHAGNTASGCRGASMAALLSVTTACSNSIKHGKFQVSDYIEDMIDIFISSRPTAFHTQYTQARSLSSTRDVGYAADAR